MWATQRQSTVALSTIETELHTSIEGATMIQSCTPILASLVGIGEESLQKVLYILISINLFNYSIPRW